MAQRKVKYREKKYTAMEISQMHAVINRYISYGMNIVILGKVSGGGYGQVFFGDKRSCNGAVLRCAKEIMSK